MQHDQMPLASWTGLPFFINNSTYSSRSNGPKLKQFQHTPSLPGTQVLTPPPFSQHQQVFVDQRETARQAHTTRNQTSSQQESGRHPIRPRSQGCRLESQADTPSDRVVKGVDWRVRPTPHRTEKSWNVDWRVRSTPHRTEKS